MYPSKIDQIKKPKYIAVIRQALLEDDVENDITSKALIHPSHRMGRAKIISKEEGILAGGFIAKEVFVSMDFLFNAEQLVEEGSVFKRGDVIL